MRQSFFSLFKKLKKTSPRRAPAPRRPARLGLEALEDRQLLTAALGTAALHHLVPQRSAPHQARTIQPAPTTGGPIQIIMNQAQTSDRPAHQGHHHGLDGEGWHSQHGHHHGRDGEGSSSEQAPEPDCRMDGDRWQMPPQPGSPDTGNPAPITPPPGASGASNPAPTPGQPSSPGPGDPSLTTPPPGSHGADNPVPTTPPPGSPGASNPAPTPGQPGSPVPGNPSPTTPPPGSPGAGNPAPTTPPPGSPGANNPSQAPAQPNSPLPGNLSSTTPPPGDSSSVLTVTSAADDNRAGTLRKAIAQANEDAAQGRSDTIVFDKSLAGDTISLKQGELELSGNGGTTTIDGGGQITINGNQSSRVFGVDGGAQVILNGLTVSGGRALDAGGGILNLGTLTVNTSTITANQSDLKGLAGGGIENRFGNLVLNNSTVSKNTASQGSGGGIENDYGTVTVNRSTLSQNQGSLGGGLSNFDGAVTVYASTVDNNIARGSDGFGGGLVDMGGPMSVVNSTVADNSAQTSGGGIAVAASFNNPIQVWVSGSTIANNFAPVGAGAVTGPGAKMMIVDSIVAGNAGSSDISGIAGGYHVLVGNGNEVIGIVDGQDGNHVGTAARPLNPHLTSLGQWGGPTQTMLPASDSPAIHAGGPVNLLNEDINGTATTIPTQMPGTIASTPGGYVISIDGEQMLVTNVNLNTGTLTVKRGFNGTTAAAHKRGAGVFLATDQRGETRPAGSDPTRFLTPNIGAVDRT